MRHTEGFCYWAGMLAVLFGLWPLWLYGCVYSPDLRERIGTDVRGYVRDAGRWLFADGRAVRKRVRFQRAK